jgi:hypothetical protein
MLCCKDCRHFVPLSAERGHCTCYRRRERGYLKPDYRACKFFAEASYPLWKDAYWRRVIKLAPEA